MGSLLKVYRCRMILSITLNYYTNYDTCHIRVDQWVVCTVYLGADLA